ncbi:MAG: ATP-dependent DNA helicase [Acidimicrobiia bacterium]
MHEERIGPNEWDRHVATVDVPQIVVGGPGTGKTEFLCRRICHAVRSGSDPTAIAVLTFSRQSVNDIRSRLFAMIGSASYRVQVSTYHSLANRIVESHHETLGWAEPPKVLTGPEHERFILAMLQHERPADWRSTYRPILHTPAMAREVTDFVLRFHEQTRTTEDIDRADIAEWKGLAQFLERYTTELTATGRIDYGRLLKEAVAVVGNDPTIAAAYAHVLADEYQDTSRAQADLLFGLVGTDASLTVAADPYQSIYSFRGTDLHNVLEFPSTAEEFLGVVGERLVLTTSFRVPEQILAAAVNVTGRALPGAAGKVESVRRGGSVATHVFESPDAESEWIATDIERIHLMDGVELSRIAVFTRSGVDFQQRVGASLERRDLPHNLSLEQLEDQPVVRFVHDLVAAATTGPDDDIADLMRGILMGPFIAAPHGAVSDIVRIVDAGTPWSEAISTKLPAAASLGGLLDDTAWADRLPAPSGLWHLWTALPQLTVIANDDQRLSDRRAWSAFSQSITRSSERVPESTLRDHQQLAHASDIEADSLFSFRSETNDGVTIATLHRAKSTEFDVVYIANAIEGSIPDLRRRDSLLKTRLLDPHQSEDSASYVAFRLDEERRLAYTAMTRASERVVWTATAFESPSEQTEPSRFLGQVARPTTPSAASHPLTRRGFEAELRRTVRDPRADDVDRIAAIAVLADAPAHGMTDQRHRYGTVEHGPDTGFVPLDHPMSASQASDYERCPWQYAIRRFGTRRDPSSLYLELGRIIHEVLEIAEREVSGTGSQRSTLERAMRILDEAWADAPFGRDPVGLAWLRRAQTILRRLYEFWPTTARAIALEHEFEIDLGDTKWHGRVDRIEEAGGTINVVDYKTGTSALTVTEAAEALQLGLYALALKMDPVMTGGAPVTSAQFWYPGMPPNKHSIVTREFDMSNLEEVTDRLASIAGEIRAEAFGPVPDKQCDRCDYAVVCPAVPRGREAFRS